MRKNFNYVVIALFFIFIGISNVNAAAKFGTITGGKTKGTSFKVPITGAKGLVFKYDVSKIACGGANTSIHDNPNGRLITNDSVEVSCTINYDKYENLILELVDVNQNKDSVGTTYEINPSLKPTTASTAPTTSSTTPTTAPTTQPPKSKNANLKSLEVKGDDNSVILLTPAFKSDVYEYTASVLGKIKKVTITPVVEDQKANVVFSDNASTELKAGENNKIVITVTAEDGTKKAYTLNIKREALQTNATLKSLFIKECDSFQFNENIFAYDIKVAKDVQKLTLNYVPTSDKSVVEISGNDDLQDGSKVKILVTAEDNTKKEYILNIIKNENVVTTTATMQKPASAERNPLIIMGLSLVAFGLIGAIIYVVKK